MIKYDHEENWAVNCFHVACHLFLPIKKTGPHKKAYNNDKLKLMVLQYAAQSKKIRSF